MKETFEKGWVSINIEINKEQTVDKIFNLLDELQRKGITFDTGSDGKTIDWELDWSLKGAIPKAVVKFLVEKGISFNTMQVSDQAGK